MSCQLKSWSQNLGEEGERGAEISDVELGLEGGVGDSDSEVRVSVGEREGPNCRLLAPSNASRIGPSRDGYPDTKTAMSITRNLQLQLPSCALE